MSKNLKIAGWIARIVVIAIFAMVVPQKLAYGADTAAIFDAIGGRPAATATALVEALAIVLLLLPRTVVFGGLLAMATMSGAIVTHVVKIGFEGAAGMMFGMAVVALIAGGVVVFLNRGMLPGAGGGRDAGSTTSAVE